MAPGYRIYETADGWVAVAALGSTRGAALRTVVGVTDDDGLEAAIRRRSRADLLAALGAAGVPAEAVAEFQYFEVWDDPENLRSRLVVSYDQRDWGRMEQFGAFWQFGDLAPRLDRACPAVGEHSREILAESGLDDDAIAALAAAGVVTGPGLGRP